MKTKIHLVDDESVLLWVIKEYLEARGFAVATDTDPRAALLEMQRNVPDLAVLDVLMPGMDGFSLFERMRSVPALANVPVIFLTAVSELPARLKGFQIGADDYICKPFEVSELEARIKAVVWRARNALPAEAPLLDTARNMLLVEGREIFLTPSESSLISYFLSHPNMLLTTEELLNKALGYAESTGSLSTVRYHIRNLRKKLSQADLKTIHLETIGRSGYLLTTTPSR